MMRLTLAMMLVMVPALAHGLDLEGVDGTISSGELVDLGGSGFGTRTGIRYELVERFDWGENQSAVDSASSPWTSIGAGNDDPVRFSDQHARGGVGLNVRQICPDRVSGTELADMLYICGLDIRPGDYVYHQFYFKSNYEGSRVNDLYDPAKPQQTKPIRFTEGVFNYPAFTMEWNGASPVPPGAARMYTKSQGGAGDFGGGEIRIFPQGGAVPDTASWWSYEQEWLINTTTTSLDGWYKGWVTQHEEDTLWETTRENRGFFKSDDPITPLYDCFFMENYTQGHDPGVQYRLHFDDIIIVVGDEPLARVMLTNGSTPETSTLREYQEITSWSDTAIEIEVYTGEFLTAQQGYLYVIDAAGNWSNAVGVEVDGTASGLGPPTNLALVRTGDSAATTWDTGAPHTYSQVERKEDGRLRRIEMLFNVDESFTRQVNSATSLTTVIRAYDASGEIQGASSEVNTPPP